MNIVILDGQIVNPGDLEWTSLQDLGTVTIYHSTDYENIINHSADADILVTNKCKIDHDIIRNLPQLKCICLLATGYNNIDISAARTHNVTVCNASGYSTSSVAQHVFALLLELTNQVGQHSQEVTQGTWTKKGVWSYWNNPIVELAGLTMGIYGLGNIGTKVAQIALAMDMKVIATRKSNKPPSIPNIQLVSNQELFAESDVISLHAPLVENNYHVINAKTLSMMKSSTYIINTGRGDLINENDLRQALEKGNLAGAAVDVLSSEPPRDNHPLIGASNCIITPHQAWASKASRSRLIECVQLNISAFISGNPINVVN